MTFKIVTAGERHRVHLDGEPDWVRGLTSGDGPDAVGVGPSLVVAFSIWSTPDRESAYLAIDVGRNENISAAVFLLPFDFPEELMVWKTKFSSRPGEVVVSSRTDQSSVEVSMSPNVDATPVWMLILDGSVIETRQGQLNADEVRSLLQATIRR